MNKKRLLLIVGVGAGALGTALAAAAVRALRRSDRRRPNRPDRGQHYDGLRLGKALAGWHGWACGR